ncbi:MAG: putative sulfite:cytochrome c oxidoreductase (Subunit b) protein [Pedosphaera sp.]|nr:putative sulfite:cytochrome c oxidoreductase (Subunit b) protein [Pedosphaera sp.]
MLFNYLPNKQIGWKFIRMLAVSLSLVAFCLVVRAAEKSFTLPPETASLKPGPGVDLASQCLICHSADYIGTQPRLTRTVWKAEVIKMQQKYGAPIATNTVDRIVDYLTTNYGQENPTPPPVAK